MPGTETILLAKQHEHEIAIDNISKDKIFKYKY